MFIIGPGQTPTTFIVPKELVCYHSEVFKKAFDSNVIKDETQTHRLENTTGRAFHLLIQWMCTKKLKLRQLNDSSVNIPDEVIDDENNSLVELWVLADNLSMLSLQNHVLDRIHEINEKHHRVATSTSRTSTRTPLLEVRFEDTWSISVPGASTRQLFLTIVKPSLGGCLST